MNRWAARSDFVSHAGKYTLLERDYAADEDEDMPDAPAASVVSQIAYLQAVALAGMARFLTGDRAVVWKKPDRGA